MIEGIQEGTPQGRAFRGLIVSGTDRTGEQNILKPDEGLSVG
jgi:hypothetical protein